MAKRRAEDGVVRGSDAAFPKEEIDARQRSLKRALAAAGIDLYMTSGAENIFWLSGQQTPGYYTFQCLAVPAKGAPFLMLRGLETYNARANTYLSRIVGYADDADPGDAVAEIVAARGFKDRAYRDRSQRLVSHREPVRPAADRARAGSRTAVGSWNRYAG